MCFSKGDVKGKNSCLKKKHTFFCLVRKVSYQEGFSIKNLTSCFPKLRILGRTIFHTPLADFIA